MARPDAATRPPRARAQNASVAPDGPRFWLETFGCQMNVLDSELVAGRLLGLGYRAAASAAEAEVVLLNTCSVRDLAEHKVWSRLGRLEHTHAGARIAVLGCMAERQAAALAERMPHVDVICGPSQLHRLPELLAQSAGRRAGAAPASACGSAARAAARRPPPDGCLPDGLTAMDRERPPSGSASRQAFVRITRGCNKFCSFCVVPFTRGPEVHRPPADLALEVRRLADDGVQEVTLLGQTVNHYHHRDGGRSTSFADLLVLLHDAAPALPRLRFLTSYPRDFGDDALDAMAACPRICRYLHIPAQSGSDAVLGRMNRGYRRDAYLELIARARRRMPDIVISGDMIAGFPGETWDDLELSLSLLDAVRYKSCFVFKYSPRSGTVAHRRLVDDVPEAEKKARLQALLARQREISLAHHRRLVGQRLPVLVDRLAVMGPTLVNLGGRAWRRLLGRTGGDEIVAFDGPPRALGRIVEVEATAATHVTVTGRLVEAPGAAAVAGAPLAGGRAI